VFGDISQALLRAARDAGRGTVRDLARRAQVGMPSARYTASRLVSAGALVVVQEGRPAVLAPRECAPDLGMRLDVVETALRGFWDR
jgi:hypothetical protein